MEKPLVSVFVLTYNSSKTVVETLDSIYQLTYPQIELIVSDDASKDNTVEVCKDWIEEHKARFANVQLMTVPKNTGTTQNFHRAVAACHADWLKGIAGDDALYPDSISNLMDFCAEHKEARMILGNAGRFDTLLDDAHFTGVSGPDLDVIKVSTAKQQYDILLCWACIDAPAVFYHRSVFEEPELQNCGYGVLEDYPLFLRYTKLGHYIYYCDTMVCKYRQSATSVQRTNNYSNLITKSYLAHFFGETHAYYHGIEKVARYLVNYHTWVNCYCKSEVLRKLFNFFAYPIYWVFYRIQQKKNFKRIENAVRKG